jgi:TonB dependent receptor/TonB-dependent Receptor Plug Domain
MPQALRRFMLPLLLLLPAIGQAQKVFDLPISGDYRDLTMIEMLIDFEKRYPVRFYYEPADLPYYKIEYEFKNQSLYSILQTMLPQNGLACLAARENGVVILKKGNLNKAYIEELLKKWDDKKIELPEFLTPLELTAQIGAPPAADRPVTIELTVKDAQNLEPIPGVTVRTETGDAGAVTTRLGSAVLTLKPGEHLLNLQYLGYRETKLRLNVYQAGTSEVKMEIKAFELAGVEIQGNKAANKKEAVATGVEMLSSKTMRELPTFMGESDVIKSLLVLPGVSTVGEGAAGFNVRGGNIDQNLVVQDELPFFNTSHVLGFFSVFNPDLVGTTTLYKGHIPARFGGRVASVLEVKLKDGNFSEWHGNIGAGLAAAKLKLEGPVLKNKLAVSFGARASYSDWMLKRASIPNIKQSSAWYNDLNLKVSARAGKNGSVSTGLHRSEDYFRFSRDFGYKWRTQGANIAWRQNWREGILTTLTAASGRLDNQYFLPEGVEAFDLKNGLAYQTVNLQLSVFQYAKHEITAGAQWNRNGTLAQELTPRGTDSGIVGKDTPRKNGEEWAAFVEDEFKISPKLTLSAGLRYSYFRAIGKGRVFLYEPNTPFSDETVTDTVEYGTNAGIANYGGFEPRVSLNWKVVDRHSVKLSYNRLRQYLHLISNTTAPTPADVWQPSGPYLAPQIADSYGAGWFYETEEKEYEASLEGFYRNTNNVPAYIDFAQLLVNENLETELVAGKQRSYGTEWLIRKNRGRWSGWASYTWSRVWQQARSPFPALSVNRGAWFPANFDQPHQAIAYAKYAFNPSFYFTFNFTYRTGRPITAPESGYRVGSVLAPNYAARNNLRIPDYHRLDIGCTIDKSQSKLEGLRWTLNLSAYNVYSRKNPFAVFFRRDTNGLPKAYQIAVIGNVIPSANLTFFW